MKTPITIKQRACLYPYTKKGKGGIYITPNELIENFNPIKDNDRHDLAKYAIIKKAMFNHLNN